MRIHPNRLKPLLIIFFVFLTSCNQENTNTDRSNHTFSDTSGQGIRVGEIKNDERYLTISLLNYEDENTKEEVQLFLYKKEDSKYVEKKKITRYISIKSRMAKTVRIKIKDQYGKGEYKIVVRTSGYKKILKFIL